MQRVGRKHSLKASFGPGGWLIHIQGHGLEQLRPRRWRQPTPLPQAHPQGLQPIRPLAQLPTQPSELLAEVGAVLARTRTDLQHLRGGGKPGAQRGQDRLFVALASG